MGRQKLNTRRYTTAQLLRFPMVFGGVIATLMVCFAFRKTFFHDEIMEKRRQNEEDFARNTAIYERAMEMSFQDPKTRPR